MYERQGLRVRLANRANGMLGAKDSDVGNVEVIRAKVSGKLTSREVHYEERMSAR